MTRRKTTRSSVRRATIRMAKRRSVNFPGFSHANPIPNASRIGNIMMSSVINGRDPETAQMPEDMAAQVVNIFKHVAAAVAHEGGSPEDILKISLITVISKQTLKIRNFI